MAKRERIPYRQTMRHWRTVVGAPVFVIGFVLIALARHFAERSGLIDPATAMFAVFVLTAVVYLVLVFRETARRKRNGIPFH